MATLTAIGLFQVLLVTGIAAQELSPSAHQRQERLDEMRERAAEIVVEVGESSKFAKAEAVAEPLLRFSDPTRAFHDGTLWLWTMRGQPVLLFSVERYEAYWSGEYVSLTTAPLRVSNASDWIWMPTPAAVDRNSIPDAPAVAASRLGRQQQARNLARRFGAVEFVPERIQLRLQPRPIHEYAVETSEPSMGAMFVLSNGTNPEVLLTLEANLATSKGPGWSYFLARISTAALEATLDGKTIWRVEPEQSPQSSKPYTYFGIPFATP